MDIKHQMFKTIYKTTLLLAMTLGSINDINAEEKVTNEQVKANDLILFNVTNLRLSESTSSDEQIWLNINNHKHLLLKNLSNGRKERGNVLLLHAQGENADHFRLINPLSKQLTRLGWNVFIPNIAKEDYPIHLNKKPSNLSEQDKETAKNDSKPETSNNTEKLNKGLNDTNLNNSFKDHQEYQVYFNNLCKSIFEQTDLSKMPYIIIANQNTAYWLLDYLQNANKQTPVIFLQPQLPTSITNNLSEIFKKLSNPIFSFHVTHEKEDTFNKAFKKRLWKSRYQQFNTGMFSSSNLHKENNSVAKTFTGWIEKQRKK